jgi:hypothetical protein
MKHLKKFENNMTHGNVDKFDPEVRELYYQVLDIAHSDTVVGEINKLFDQFQEDMDEKDGETPNLYYIYITNLSESDPDFREEGDILGVYEAFSQSHVRILHLIEFRILGDLNDPSLKVRGISEENINIRVQLLQQEIDIWRNVKRLDK